MTRVTIAFVLAIAAFACAPPEVGLSGPICLDVSRLEPHQVEASLEASKIWEPHFEQITIEHNPACPNYIDVKWHDEFIGTTKPATTHLSYTATLERGDTQIFIRPDLDVPQWALVQILTHELAHVFGLVDHTHDGGLLSARPYLKRSLKLTEADRARVAELYE